MGIPLQRHLAHDSRMLLQAQQTQTAVQPRRQEIQIPRWQEYIPQGMQETTQRSRRRSG